MNLSTRITAEDQDRQFTDVCVYYKCRNNNNNNKPKCHAAVVAVGPSIVDHLVDISLTPGIQFDVILVEEVADGCSIL